MNVLVWYWGREASKYVFDLTCALRDRPNLNLVLSCSRDSDLHREASKIADLPIIPITTITAMRQSWRGKLSALRGISALPITILRFHRLLRKHKIDIALCAQSSIWDAVTIPSLLRSRACYVQVAHELRAHPGDGYPLRDRVTELQVATADGIVVLSEQNRRQVVESGYPPERCWKMPHALYVFGEEPITAAVHPRGRRPLNLLFFGRISPYKGLDRLFAAMELLRQRDVPCKLIIAGSGNLDAFQDQIAAHDVEVHNAWLDEERIAVLLARSDVVVLPYERSSQSGVAAAAHAAGRPVVGTPLNGLREQVLPSTGLLAHDMSAEAFADALTELITDPDLFDRCAAGALQHAQANLDWRKCAEVLHEAIQHVCAMPRRRTRQSRLARLIKQGASAMIVLLSLIMPAASEPPLTAPTDWPLTFQDDFKHLNVSHFDTSLWTTRFPWNGHFVPGSKEEQFYVEPSSGINPFSVNDGVLTITANRASPDLGPRIEGRRYTSGLLTTYHSFSQLYGYFEMRAKFPPGRGLWPTFWLLPIDLSWPPEIDVIEAIGEPNKYYATVHYDKPKPDHHVGFSPRVPDTTADFHAYGVLWSPEYIAWYFDQRRIGFTKTPSDMHRKKMYMLINLAVGGSWPGSPTPETPFPANLQISYVRAYKIPTLAQR